MSSILTRRRLLVTGLGAMGPLLVGCKRTAAPKVEEVWDEAPAVGQAEALGSLAPPWGAPTRAVLDSGLITFWLHEPGTPVTHLRVLLPVGDEEALLSASVVAVLQSHLVATLTGRGRNRAISVDARFGPDRLEMALHGPDDQTAAALSVLAAVLGARAPAAGLEAARTDVMARLDATVSPDERATAALVGALLGRDESEQRADRAELEALSRDALLEGWEALVDPRRAVLVVHSGDDATPHRPALRQLAERWRGRGRRPVPPSAIERLRATPAPPVLPGRLLAEPATPLRILSGPGSGPSGDAVLMLGRVLPTPSAGDRSLARLAQRVLQEELDARLVIRGDYGIFVLRVPLSSHEPERSASEAIDALVELAQDRQPQQRLFQAAQLWLGARVVQASLGGEDWTLLWSDATDLASTDEEIAAALARDATTMLEPEPEAFQAWLRRWLDPRGGEPGWQWLVAGAPERITRRLARIAPLEDAG
ncbi:MAG: hypothetical protein H6712_17115 [Myxococcales bacterium]|nr:hypothetical protein [Myxococcales bacterium]